MSTGETGEPISSETAPQDGVEAQTEPDETREDPETDQADEETTDRGSQVADEDAERAVSEGELDPLEAAQAEARENYDRFLRAKAELDNYRKRTAKVRSESREEAVRDVLLQIAPILDNMRRALAQENTDLKSFKEGVELINSQFQEALRGYGLEEIEAIGQPFDPALHEALLEVEHPDHPPGTVVEEMEKGYKLNNKVVRPTRVIVSKASAETDGEHKPSEGDG